jgi:hypothetical protein
MSALEANARLLSSWFGITEANAKKWLQGTVTLERLLNLSSEDAVITNFIIPIFQRALGYKVEEIDIKPQLTINYGRQVKRSGGESDVVVRKGKSPVIVIEAKSYGHPLQSSTENAEGQAFDYTRANELKPRPKYYITTNVVETHIYDTLTRAQLLFSPIHESELVSKFTVISDLTKRTIIVPIGATTAEAVVRTPVTDQRDFERFYTNAKTICGKRVNPRLD